MERHHVIALALSLFLIGACQPLPREEETPVDTAELGYLPLDSLPAEWGQLVAVTPHFNRSGPSDWYELWFSEPVSGRVTLVSVYRPNLTYALDVVRVIERVPGGGALPTPPSAP